MSSPSANCHIEAVPSNLQTLLRERLHSLDAHNAEQNAMDEFFFSTTDTCEIVFKQSVFSEDSVEDQFRFLTRRFKECAGLGRSDEPDSMFFLSLSRFVCRLLLCTVRLTCCAACRARQ